jgi:hypothetical protein
MRKKNQDRQCGLPPMNPEGIVVMAGLFLFLAAGKHE